jgi:uncharacterized membrane protein YidH (DUF202 family)
MVVARDHLANERTFLSWVRTYMAFFGKSVRLVYKFALHISAAGIAFLSRGFSYPAGYIFLALSLLFSIIGLHRYYIVQGDLNSGVNLPLLRYSFKQSTT